MSAEQLLKELQDAADLKEENERLRALNAALEAALKEALHSHKINKKLMEAAQDAECSLWSICEGDTETADRIGQKLRIALATARRQQNKKPPAPKDRRQVI